jgi:hypothetical protein
MKLKSDMKTNLLTLVGLAVGGLCFLGDPRPAAAQSADALIDKLVEKGILTVKEGNQLREETDKDFTRAYSVKSGLPDWVTSFRINGDMRGRYEGFYAPQAAFVDRSRLRYRLRAGFTATIQDALEVGFRLTSGEASGGFGGDPISGNTSLSDNGSKKFVYFDLAYGKWSPTINEQWSAATTFGKMENPYVFPSTMMFDKDYTPEGLAQEIVFRPDDRHTLRLVGGFFILDEVRTQSEDPYMLGGQLRWDAVWTPKISSTLGVGMFGILGGTGFALTNGAVPNIGGGNTRQPGTGALAFNYNPVYLDAGFTYNFEKGPMYNAAFPVTLSGDYAYNGGASGQDNIGYTAGVTFGKAGKKGLWQFDYRYTYLGADAWYEEFPESDFGAYYAATQPNSGNSAGYFSGTNVKGHWFKLSYSPYDALTFSVAYFLTELIREVPNGSDSQMGRLQVDAVWKF